MNKYTIQIQTIETFVTVESESEESALIEVEERLPELIDWQVVGGRY